jgi:hypothetical protein
MQDIPKVIPIKKVIKETGFVKTFVFEHDLGAKPGQFVNVWIPRVNEKPMSIAYWIFRRRCMNWVRALWLEFADHTAKAFPLNRSSI